MPAEEGAETRSLTAPAGRGALDALLWRWNRLRCMSPAEVAHRAVRAAQARAECWTLAARKAVPAARIGEAVPRFIDPDPGVQPERYREAARRIACGRFDVFVLHDVELGSPPRWNRDPKTGREAPLEFGKLLDYRDAARVGDIKYLWEPNRHLHLVTLAQAFALSGELGCFNVLREHLESWWQQCPYRLGPNWSSALEAALRLINWSIAWQLLGGAGSRCFRDSEGERFRDRWLESVYQHAQFVRGFYSLYSSANNHLLGEAAGLAIAALTWPHWEETRAWYREAQELLERHALLQNAADGVNREQATSYQQFSFDLLLLALLAARANGRSFSAALEHRMESMLEYLASVMDVSGNVPMFGDADDGFVVRLSQEPGFCRYRSLLATGALLFGRPEFKAKAGTLDDKTRWLLGRDAEARFEALDARAARLPVRLAFPEGGYYVMGCAFETPREVRLVVDAGPLGYERIAAHGHADALSFTLSVGGLEFLIDPGTYAYHTQEAWRAYFRGTRAHNTVRIDGLDQSQPGGNFMWLKKANAFCTRWSVSRGEDVFEGWHDGYCRLADPVRHRRRIRFDKVRRTILLQDVLDMRKRHTVELFFHCAERCLVQPAPGGYRVVQAQTEIFLRMPHAAGARCALYRGSVSPPAGWASRRFDDKAPCWTIAWRASLEGPCVLESALRC